MNTENIRGIKAIHTKAGDPVFRMAISHLFDVGTRNLTEVSVEDTKQHINETTKSNSFMTADFQCALIDIAFELSKFSIWDLLLYIKLYIGIDGDNLVNKENAQDAIRMWATEKSEWQEAVKDEDLFDEIVSELVDQHMHNNYTRDEVENAINYVLEQV